MFDTGKLVRWDSFLSYLTEDSQRQEGKTFFLESYNFFDGFDSSLLKVFLQWNTVTIKMFGINFKLFELRIL